MNRRAAGYQNRASYAAALMDGPFVAVATSTLAGRH
jgi:hypothetical protein